eukprot:10414737-Ditylum_brightwellii.AAC.1
MTSYRIELTGILSALYLLQLLLRYTHIILAECPPLYCDNNSAVTATNNGIQPGIKAHLSSDFDVISELYNVKQCMPPFRASWVKAHQDDKADLEDPTLDAQLNVMADVDVNSFQVNTPTGLAPAFTPILFPTQRAYITIN